MNKYALGIIVLSAVGTVWAEPVGMVQDRGSEMVIYCDAEAPRSVAMAASELQRYVHEVSGAKLAIVHQPGAPMICLGENAGARAAGLSAEDIPVEGFRIVTRGGNVYILGPDTGGGGQTAGSGDPPELQRQWERLLARWTQVTENISYYDLPARISTWCYVPRGTAPSG